MKSVSFTEFRERASELFSEVEGGETVVVLRHGKPIAEVSPISAERAVPSWKRPRLKLVSKGKALSRAILEERKDADIL